MLEIMKILTVPSGMGAALFVMGLLMLVWRHTRHWARPLLLASGAVIFVFSTGPVATALLSPLEYEYPAMATPEQYTNVHTIVLLTAYASEDSSMPLSSRMNSSAAFRVLETAALAYRRPDCVILVSGNSIAAGVMAQQLVAMGIEETRITLDPNAVNTAASAASIANRVRGQPVFLVTSSGHMRRSLAVFNRQGVDAVPVPADHQLPASIADAKWNVSPFHLAASDLAVHEYVGLLWYWLRDLA